MVLVAARRDTMVPLRSQDHGIVVVRVETGASAVSVARESTPAVIMLDMTLPDASGLDVCRQLRGDPTIDRGIPILLLATAKPTAEQRVAALRFGAWDFVQLPTSEHELSSKARLYAEAKWHFERTLAAERIEYSAGLHTPSDLVRQAQQIGSLMRRMHSGLACIVFEISGGPTSPVALAIARAARASDVVGVISHGRIGVVAPATDRHGAVLLAQRIGEEARRVTTEDNVEGAFYKGSRLLAGYDAVANAMYSPVDPVSLLHSAARAVRNGTVEPGTVWLRSAEPLEPAESVVEVERTLMHTNRRSS